MKKKLTALLLVTVLLFVPLMTFAADEPVTPKGYTVLKVLRDYAKAWYQFDVTEEEMLDSVLNKLLTDHPELFPELAEGIMDSLDEHSVYYTPEEFSDFNAYIEAEFGGIGVSLIRAESDMVIASVLSGTPAERAGLAVGDKIVAVDGESTVGFDTDMVVSRIRGDIGTSVVLQVVRDEQTLDFTLTRELIRSTSVYSHYLEEEKIGYLQIEQFATSTSKEFEEQFAALKEQGAERFIVDLRFNGGGLTDEACQIATMFIPKDAVIFELRSRGDGMDMPYINYREPENVPLVVLVNEYTASASEILAAAIKENHAGVLVGTNTYGKGTMQTTSSLGQYGAIKMTIGEFFSPNGNTINKVGVSPDLRVNNQVRGVEADDLVPLSFAGEYRLGDVNDDIYAIKQRLSVLGLFHGTKDDFFSEALDEAVRTFQVNVGREATGVLDIETQVIINNLTMGTEATFDTQLDKAIEVVQAM